MTDSRGKGTPKLILTAAGVYKTFVREWKITKSIRLINQLKKNRKELADYLHGMTEPERIMLAKKLGIMSDTELYYTYGQGSL